VVCYLIMTGYTKHGCMTESQWCTFSSFGLNAFAVPDKNHFLNDLPCLVGCLLCGDQFFTWHMPLNLMHHPTPSHLYLVTSTE